MKLRARVIATVVTFVVGVTMFAFGFTWIDAIYQPGKITLGTVSEGQAGWQDFAHDYVTAHVTFDLIFIAVYIAFFLFASTLMTGWPRIAMRVMAGLALLLDVTEDLLFLSDWSNPALSIAKLVAFFGTLGLVVVGLIGFRLQRT